MFARLVWKEFRALLPLWLGLFGGGFLLLMSIQLSDSPWTAAPLTSLALALGGSFGLAAAAMQFAGEAEDGTVDWLRGLPLEGRTVWGAKLLVNGGGTVAMLALLSGLAMLVNRWPLLGNGQYADEAREFFNVERIVRFGLGAPFLGAAVSVRLRSVLAAVLVSAACGVFLSWLGVQISYWNEGPAWGLLAVQMAVTGWLSLRWTNGWCTNSDFAAPRPTAIPAVRAGGTASLARSRWDLWCDRHETRRMWRSLLWQELRRARVFVLWALGIIVVGSLFTAFVSGNGRLGFLMFALTPIVAGLWSLRGEQFRGSHAFYGDRGISATAVWWSKHLVWFTVAVGIAIPCLLADAWLEGIPRQAAGATQYSWSGAPLNRHPVGERMVNEAARVAPMLVALYGISHLVALCSARLILAIAFALVGCILWMAWSEYEVYWDGASPWITALLCGLAALMAAGLMAGRWLRRRSLLWPKGIMLAGAVILPLLLSTAFARVRYWSIPDEPLPQNLTEAMASVEARLKSPDDQASADYRVALDKAGRDEPIPVPEPPPGVEPPAATAKWQPKLPEGWLDRLAKLGEQHLSGGRSPLLNPSMIRDDRGLRDWVHRLMLRHDHMQAALDDSRKHLDPLVEWRQLLGLLRLCRLAESQGPWEPVYASHGNPYGPLFTRVVDWASQQRVDARMLVDAIEDIAMEVRGLPPVYERWLVRRVLAEAYLKGDRDALLRHLEANTLVNLQVAEQTGQRPRGLWRDRLLKAHQATLVAPWRELSSLNLIWRYSPTGLAQPGLFLKELSSLDPQIDPSHMLAANNQTLAEQELSRATYPMDNLIWEHSRPAETMRTLQHRNQYRLLLATLAVTHRSKVDGKLPASLINIGLPAYSRNRQRPSVYVAERPGERILNDLFTGRPFEYEPNGMGTLALTGPNAGGIYSPDQPLIWSVSASSNYWTTVAAKPGPELKTPHSLVPLLRFTSRRGRGGSDDVPDLSKARLLDVQLPIRAVFDGQ